MDIENGLGGLASAVPQLPAVDRSGPGGEKAGKVDEKLGFDKDYENGSMSASEEEGSEEVLSDARDLVTHVISVEDDRTLNCWTFRVLVIGVGLSAFGGVLGTRLIPFPPPPRR
jgi:hypothetical protein